MNTHNAEVIPGPGSPARYARVVAASKKTEWQIDRDLIRGRTFDFSRKFLPDGLTLVDRLPFLAADEARALSQVQGRTYAYVFGLVERFISAAMLDHGRARIFGDQVELESLVRFSNEEIKHQELFRRMETMMAPHMPAGYRQVADPNDVARVVLATSAWSVLALTCHIELFVQSHYAESIAPRTELCPLFADVFKYHWKDECQHVVVDELLWKEEDARLPPAGRDKAVDDFITLVAAVDGILQVQATDDTHYFLGHLGRTLGTHEASRLEATMLAAYRWQYIVSGAQHPHFGRLLSGMTTPAQLARIQAALAPIVASLGE